MHVHMNLGLYIIPPCTKSDMKTQITYKHAHSQLCTPCMYVGHMFIHPHETLSNKKRFMHMWKDSHIFSQTCTPAQEELLTLITDTLMERHPHTHTLKCTYRSRGACIYSLNTVLQHTLLKQTMVNTNIHLQIIRTVQTAQLEHLYIQTDTHLGIFTHTHLDVCEYTGKYIDMFT